MPEVSSGHAAALSQPSQPSQMDQPATAHRRLLDDPSPPPPLRPRTRLPEVDDASVAISGAVRAEQKLINTRSIDYVIRSGVAGGLAGCAVSTTVLNTKGFEIDK